MQKLLNKLKEPSTFRGLAILSGVVGVVISPDQIAAIGALVASVIGVIEVFRKEKQ